MPEAPYGRSNCWLTCVVVDPERSGTDRERIRLALEAEDVESRPLWKPMHLQPFFADAPLYGGEVSATLFERGLCLPSGSSLGADDQRRVVEILLATRS
jgi:pyridoxal phosphate-dependent aminotransferase EpsN